MVKLLLKFGIRSLSRQRLYTLINVAGLVVGFFSFMMIILYVRHERSFDKFHSNGEQIYRLISHSKARSVAVTPYVWGKFLKEEIPEIKELTALNTFNLAVKKGDDVFAERDIVSADSTFFNIFQFPVIAGNPDDFLREPNKTVITPELAQKYFGDEDPVGKFLEVDMFDHFMTFEVQGVVECPENSHLQFNMLLPIGPFKVYSPNPSAYEHWRIHFIYNYMLMPADIDREQLKKNFSAFLLRHAGKEVMEAYQPDVEALGDIYLHSDLEFDLPLRGDESNNRILDFVAMGILLMAIINFINISSAQSLRRAKEVGVRKVFGSQRHSLIIQFVIESLIVALASLIIAVVLAILVLPSYNSLLDKNFLMADILNPNVLWFMLAVSLGVGIVSGAYPALVMSAYKPISVLRSRSAGRAKGAFARKVLVTIQFTLAVVLILSTGVIYKQVSFMSDKPLGFDKEQILTLNGVGKIASSASRTEVLRQELLQRDQITALSASSAHIGFQTNAMRYSPTGFGGEESPSFSTIFVDHDYAGTYNLEMVNGRFFDRSIPTDSGALVINETALKFLSARDASWLTDLDSKRMGWTSFAGHTGESRIIGVVKDFNFASLKTEIKPLVFKMEPQFFYTIQMKMSSSDIANTVSSVEDTWKRLFPEVPFEYNFVDEQFERHFEQEEQLGDLLSVFALLSVLIGMLGLFGLASFLVIEKEKEMSIRKVTGASEFEILKQLSWVFLKLVLISNAIALPFGFLLMDQWLNAFAFRVDMPMGIFLAAVGISLLVTVLTVGYHSLRTARVNPARILAQE